MFSFCVPVYNVQKYLGDCIESLLCQKGDEFEILLLDDGSTDKSGQICDEYANKYPEQIRVVHKKNEGLLLTRRSCFQLAKGDWFICVDSDDYVSPELLLTVVATIQSSNCDMVMYNFDYVDENGKYTPSRLHIPDGTVYEGRTKQNIYEKRLLSADVNSMCMRAMKRDIVDIFADYSGYGIKNMSEDMLQDLAVYTNAKKIVYLSTPFYHYRKGQASITARVTYEKWQSTYICHCETEKYLDIWQVPETVKVQYYSRNCELITNFTRWLVDENNEEQLRKTIDRIKADELFKRCCDNFDKHYTSTKYMRLVVPIIIQLIRTGNTTALKLLIKTERKILAAR